MTWNGSMFATLYRRYMWGANYDQHTGFRPSPQASADCRPPWGDGWRPLVEHQWCSWQQGTAPYEPRFRQDPPLCPGPSGVRGRARSAERFPPVPGCFTLWALPADIEDEFDAQWAEWLDEGASWREFFEGLQQQDGDLLAALRAHGLLDTDHEEQVAQMRRSGEGRTVPVSGIRNIDDDTVTLLAAGFSRGEAGKPAIPYARVEG